MEEPSKEVKCNILACLPKAASPFSFQLSPPHTPVKASARKGFSGPTISLIPKEARRKPKNESVEAPEPTSPKVSCMGQVKIKKNKKKTMSKGNPKPKPVVPQVQETAPVVYPKELNKKPLSTTKGKKQGDTIIDNNKPSLGQIKQYTSSRGGILENFDWRACEEEEDNKEKDKEKNIFPRSAPTVGGEPRKEVMLRKRTNKSPALPLRA